MLTPKEIKDHTLGKILDRKSMQILAYMADETIKEWDICGCGLFAEFIKWGVFNKWMDFVRRN